MESGLEGHQEDQSREVVGLIESNRTERFSLFKFDGSTEEFSLTL